ncbi:Glycosyltransferase involved in cell wall bisynthesis [Actinomyces ruminicola]|uniref:Glycosyltransferase involved in cell wall bisynthesis n=1 Tax=Actinomyces ruminicola TaxID=332524 RepID=A0A1G9ZLB4_9ACTO|nr:Glycosyltransferase involved in cell wall bisynthesis [Actinomyces ruminicola]
MPEAQRLRNLSLLLDTAARHVAEDPLLLAVQSARRLPPGVRGHLARAVSAGAGAESVRLALGEFLADRRAQAGQALAAATPRTGAGRRVAAELAVQLGRVAPKAQVQLPPSVRARELWSQGRLHAAVAVLDGVRGARAQRARLRSQLAVMSPGFALPAVVPSPAWEGPRSDGPTRVLHVLTNSFSRTQSGYAVRSHAVLRAQRAAGVEVRAVTRIGYPVTVGLVNAASEDVVDGITYRRLLPARLAPTPAARLVQMTRLLAREVEDYRPHVLHTTTNFQNALVARAVAESYGLPWVYEMRGVLEQTWVASRPTDQQAEALASERFRLLRARETEMAVAADAVVVLSQVQREDLIARGVPTERIRIIPNAVDDAVLEVPEVSAAEARARLGLPRGGFWAGSVSSLVDYEGFDVLLEAVARCRASGVDVRCLLVGDGVSRAGLEARSAELGLGTEVCVLPGRVPPQDAVAWYQALDLFCVPRRDTPVCRSVTPIKPFTAMALGRAVLVSDLPALREVAAYGDGSVFPAEDAVALATALAAAAGCAGNPHASGQNGSHTSVPADLPTWSRNGTVYATLYEGLR